MKCKFRLVWLNRRYTLTETNAQESPGSHYLERGPCMELISETPS